MRLKTGEWGEGRTACLKCGGTERPHKGRGLCGACIQRERMESPAQAVRRRERQKAYVLRNTEAHYARTKAWREANKKRHHELSQASRKRLAEERGYTDNTKYIPGSTIWHPLAGRITILAKAYQKRGVWHLMVKNRHGETLEIQTKELTGRREDRGGEAAKVVANGGSEMTEEQQR